MYRSLFIPAAVLILLAVSPTLRADEVPVGTVEIVAADSFLCRTLAINPQETSRSGYLRTLTAPKGKAFLVLWTKLKPKWAKNKDGESAISMNDKHILLKDSKGSASFVAGTCTRDGRFYETEGWVSETEEYFDGEQFDYNPVFVVPDAEREFTLQIATGTRKITAPMKIEDRLASTRVGTFTVDSVRVVKSLGKTRELRRYTDDEIKGVAEKIVTPATSYLIVKFIIKPKMANEYSGNFYVSSYQFGVKYGAQVYVPPIGYFEDGDYYDGYVSVGDEADAAGEFRAEAMELAFPLPGRLTKFRALYMMEDFGGAEIPQE